MSNTEFADMNNVLMKDSRLNKTITINNLPPMIISDVLEYISSVSNISCKVKNSERIGSILIHINSLNTPIYKILSGITSLLSYC